MTNTDQAIVPLRIANEAFLVAATIERCPKLMMLRELVMNAIESAAGAAAGARQVRVGALMVEGTPKLRIWNTGRGMTASELLQVSDLSSSLFKEVSLDGNFGMGAKAASLTSNRHGLRYRSCRLGQVSQITLGERGLIYGRLLQLDPKTGEMAEVIDVTEICAQENLHSLAQDWTEVVLLGNRADQDTTQDPYDSDPVVTRDWVVQTLGKRYLRIAAGVTITLEPGATGASEPFDFLPPLGPSSFDRVEQVTIEGGTVLHYCFRGADSERPASLIDSTGLGAVVYEGEVYSLVEGRRWLLEAPTYGFTFAAKFCTVLVELPRGFNAQPEQYRQFLRFREGDQHQVLLADFGEVVRQNIPAWLRDLISAMMPEPEDFLAEIREELQKLLFDFGIVDELDIRPAARPTPAQTALDVAEAEDQPQGGDTPPKPIVPPARVLPKSPEIILVSDEEQLVEKALGGRAARYYPATRQIFVNTEYSAFKRMQAQLNSEFGPYADAETVDQLSVQSAQATLVRHLARTLIHSLAKPKVGWTDPEARSVQTPEALSLIIDDDSLQLPHARHSMMRLLGMEQEGIGTGNSPWADPAASKAAEDLAVAEARLQRAKAANVSRLGPLYRNIGSIHLQRRNYSAALAWLEKGIAVDPNDPWCHYELVGVYLTERNLEGAEKAADAALARGTDNPALFLRRRAEVETAKGNSDIAVALLQQAANADDQSPWPHYDLAAILLAANDFQGAAEASDAAMQRSPVPSATLLRRSAEVDLKLGNAISARQKLEKSVALDSKSAGPHLDLARFFIAQGQEADALARIDEAISSNLVGLHHFYRLRSEVEQRTGNLASALAAAEQAVRIEPNDQWNVLNLSSVLLAMGDLEGSEKAARQAVSVASSPSPHIFRRLGEIEGRRKNYSVARDWLDQAAAADPADPWCRFELSGQLLAQNSFSDAADAALAGLERQKGNKVHFMRRLGEIASRVGDKAAAREWLDKALAEDPKDPWCRLEYSNLLLQQDQLDAAMEMALSAIEVSPRPTVWPLRRCSEIEVRRGNLEAAKGWIERAAKADPADPLPWLDLSNLLRAAGDLEGAQKAAETAVIIGSPKSHNTLTPKTLADELSMA